MAHRIGAQEPGPRIYAGVTGAVARVVDTVLAPFAPGLVLSRQRARLNSAAMLNYDAAQRKRTRRQQRASSADEDLLRDLPQLRLNSRAMVRDDSSASALVQVLEENVVGTGMVPQMMVNRELARLSDSEADRWNNDVEAFFAAAGDQVDATENDDFAGLQRLALRSVVTDGEVLAHRIYIDEPRTDRLVGTAWELIDVDRLMDPTEGTERDIRSGVEMGDRQNATAYWITPRHPDDTSVRHTSARLRVNKPERYARHAGGQASILHVFRRGRVGQSRGVPFFAPVFGLVEAMNDMLETELNAARAASKFCAFIKQSLDANMPGLEQQNDGQWHEKLESATIRYLNQGEEFIPYTPNRPGNNFEPFVVRVLRSISAAIGVPYELVLKDFGQMNYSSARVALLEARRGFEVLQQLLVTKFCQPIFRSVVMDGVISGKLRMPRGFLQNPEPFLRARWQPPAWGWVDPVKEIEASRLAIESSLSTPQAEAARQGGDAEANLESRARFLSKARQVEKNYGLEPGELTKPSAPNGQQPAPQPAQEPDPAPKKKELAQ